MNVKKLLSVALAVVMLLLACPLSIFAADKNLRLETYDANGGVATTADYASFAEAFAALDTIYDNVDAAHKTSDEALYAAAGKPVIKMIGNVTAAATAINNWNKAAELDTNAVRTIVIDGDNGEGGRYTVNYSTTDAKLFSYLGTTNFHAKNVEFAMNFTGGDGAFDWGGASLAEAIETDTVFENCSINYNFTGDVNGGSLFKLNGKMKNNVVQSGAFQDGNVYTGDIFNLTVKDCTVIQTGALGVQIHWGADANIKIQNTTWTRSGGTKDYNHAFVKGYDCGTVTVNVDGASTLESRISSGTAGGTFFYATETSAFGMTVTLEQGATLYMNDQVDGKNSALVDADSTSLKIIDKGAIWKVSPAVATYGIKTESCMGETGMMGFKLGDTDVTGSYTAAEAPASDLVLTTYETDPTTQDYAVYVTNEGETAVKGYYKDIEKTFAILGNHDVIHLMKNVTFTKGEQRPTYSDYYTVTIDGTKATDGAGNVTERYKITQPVTTYNPYAFDVGNINFTLSNVILQATKGLRYHANDTANYSYSTTLNNVEMNITHGLAFKIGQDVSNTGSRTYTININDSKINHSAADAVFNSTNIAKYDITINNTEITRTKGAGSGNGYIFNLLNDLGGTVRLTGNSKMNVKNDTTNWCGVFYVHPSNPSAAINVILDAGVEMNLLSTTTTSADTEFFYNTWNSTSKKSAMQLTDHGAIYTVSANIAKLGVQLPAFTGMPYTFDNGATTTVSGNRYYGDEMVPVSAYFSDSNGNSENQSGGKTDFYIPNATGNITFTNKVMAPELYNNDPTVAMVRKDANGTVVKTYTEAQFATAYGETQTGETLVLLRDIFTTNAYTGQNNTRSFTIDGQGKYGIIQSNNVGNYLLYAPTNGNTLTLKDMTLNLMGGFWYEKAAAQNVVLDHVMMNCGAPRAFVALRTAAGDHQMHLTNGTVVTAYYNPVISANVAGGKFVVDDSILRVGANIPVINTPANCSISFVNGGSLAYTKKALASAGDTGVTLPGVVDENGAAITKWVVNGELYEGTKYANKTATADVILTPLTSLFTTLDGASVRLEAPAGMRFEAWFDDALLALDGVEVGILVTAKTETLTASTFVLDGEGKVNGQAVINQAGGQYKEDGTDNLLRVVLANIGEDLYNVEFAARAYIKLGGVTYYAGFDDENVRSMKEVAIKALTLDEYKDNTFLQAIANS